MPRFLPRFLSWTAPCTVLLFALLSAMPVLPETPATPAPVKLDVRNEALDLTDDVPTAEAQARAYPDDPEAQFLLAMAYSRTPYFERAFKAFKRAKKLIKQSPERYEGFARKITEYEGMLAYRPDDPRVLYRLAFAYFIKGYGIEHGYIQTQESPRDWYDKARATMARVIAVDPSDIWARNYLGFLLIEQDEAANLDEAMGLWEASLAVSDRNPGAYFLLGEAWMKKGDLRKAVEYGARALQARATWLGEGP